MSEDVPGPSNADLLKEIRSLQESFNEAIDLINELKTEVVDIIGDIKKEGIVKVLMRGKKA